ncbi:hypothetical protein OESDEN_04808 [Oesophagostomum dentatum]|uniref:Uncharacterized protein n=1 Tax=Oesophagostomum dentatum TaxID=61180 RepID=A0A0B1TDA7_OESDE|nr:hypothetical protein OESDEN_04808 [Oesophagostomum dentatum]
MMKDLFKSNIMVTDNITLRVTRMASTTDHLLSKTVVRSQLIIEVDLLVVEVSEEEAISGESRTISVGVVLQALEGVHSIVDEEDIAVEADFRAAISREVVGEGTGIGMNTK